MKSVNDLKFINIRDFVESGYLQEVNRRILHPLGLALTVSEDTETREMSIYGIVDNRNEPGGMIFDFDDISDDELQIMITRAANIENRLKGNVLDRLFLYGRTVQPLKKCLGMLNFMGKKHEKESDNKQ